MQTLEFTVENAVSSLDGDRQGAFSLEAASQAAAFAAVEPAAQIEAILTRQRPAFNGFPAVTPAGMERKPEEAA